MKIIVRNLQTLFCICSRTHTSYSVSATLMKHQYYTARNFIHWKLKVVFRRGFGGLELPLCDEGEQIYSLHEIKSYDMATYTQEDTTWITLSSPTRDESRNINPVISRYAMRDITMVLAVIFREKRS